MDQLKVAEAIDAIFEIYRKCNKYIDETAPWLLAKDETQKDRLNGVLYNLIESIRIATVYLQAFLPSTARSIFEQINTNITDYDTVSSFGAYDSRNIGQAHVLFQRIEKND